MNNLIKTKKYRLYQGDCLDLIDKIPDKKIRCLCCDPPYGIDYQSGRKEKEQRLKKIANDKKPFIEFIPLVLPKISDDGCGFIFTRWDVQQVFIDELKRNGANVKNVIIWNKCIHSMGDLWTVFAFQYESIIFFANKKWKFIKNRPSDIISVNKVPPDKLLHPNEKPIKLLNLLITWTTNVNDYVLDCFMGSGSTGVACMNTFRKFCGIELDKKYFTIAKDRIEQSSSSLVSQRWILDKDI
jgi:site-specific DNA-methyltransferase (adenine-specific)